MKIVRRILSSPLPALAVVAAIAGIPWNSALASAASPQPTLQPSKAAEPAASSFGSAASVITVEVPVTVTQAGQPVRGLTAADFEVYDGSTRQRITGFDVVDLAAPLATEAAAAPAAPAAAALPLAGRRHFLVFFDLSFSQPSSIARARRAARDLIHKQARPTDLIAVATYSLAEGSKILLGFSTDRRQLDYAIDTLGLAKFANSGPDALGLIASPIDELRDAGLDAVSRSTRDEDLESELAQLTSQEAVAANQTAANDVGSMSRALTDFAKLLGSVQGKKYVIYLSQGFDISVLRGTDDPDLRQASHEAAASGEVWRVSSNLTFGNTKTQREVETMLDAFRRADCTIESFNIAGLDAPADSDVQALKPGTPNRMDDALFLLAHDTGGELFHNTNDISMGMARLVERTSVSYVLSFEPEALPADGRYHPLRVKLKRGRGLQVNARPGYYAPVPFARQPVAERQLAAASLLLGTSGGRIPVSVLAAPFPVAGQKPYVPVLVEIGGPALLAGAKNDLKLDLYVYAMDEQGSAHDHFAQSLGLDLAKVRGELAAGGGLKYFGHLDLDPGRYVVKVLVRDDVTGDVTVAATPVTVPAYDAQEASLLPPLLADRPNRWLLLRETGGREKLRSVPFPFWNREKPFLPAAHPTVAAGGAEPLMLIAKGLGAGDPTVTARLYGPEGDQKGDLVLTSRTPTNQGVDHLLATFRPGNLAPGEYTLLVTLTDATTRRAISSSIPLTVSGTAAGGGA